MSSSLGLQRGRVILREYNPEWKELFKEEKHQLEEILGSKIIIIEHIGSTAIPGIKAKPILDIMLAIEYLDNWQQIQKPLTQLGYEFRKDFRKEQQHILFVKGSEESRTHYLKITELNSKFWIDNVLFRDFLTQNTKYRDQYQKLKERLSKQYQDNRELYTRDKEEFILKVLRQARSES